MYDENKSNFSMLYSVYDNDLILYLRNMGELTDMDTMSSEKTQLSL